MSRAFMTLAFAVALTCGPAAAAGADPPQCASFVSELEAAPDADQRIADAKGLLARDCPEAAADRLLALAGATGWEGHYYLGVALARSGRPEEAFPHLVLAERQAPDARAGAKALGLRQELANKMAKTHGVVQVVAAPPGAQLTVVRGSARARTVASAEAPTELLLRVGRYAVRAAWAHGDTATVATVVKAGKRAKVTVRVGDDTAADGADGGGAAGGRFRTAGWASFGAAGVALGAAGVLALMSRSKQAEYDDYVAARREPEHVRAASVELADRANTLGTAATVALAAAGVAAAAGTSLVLLATPEGDAVVRFTGTW